MNNPSVKIDDDQKAIEEATREKVKPSEKPDWDTPKMEDVSDQVMAQPYIRFT